MSQIVSGLLSAIGSLIGAVAATVWNWIEGLRGLWGVGERALAARGGGGSLASRLLPRLAEPSGQRDAFAVLRAFWPVLRIDRVLVKAYPNTATVIVTRRADVLDVLRRDEAFEVVYEPRMREITDGRNFFLGMQPGPDYARDTSAMRLAMRHDDAPARVAPRAAELSEKIVAESGGSLDAPRELTSVVPADMIETYFGLRGPDREAMIEQATVMFWWLFGDLGADPDVAQRARAAAADARDWIGKAIEERKASGETRDDVLGRCLALQQAGAPGMDDRGIRDNLIGLFIGAIPTLSKAATLALDELLDRPGELRAACAAARAGDDELMAAHLWEALRFRPHNPIIYRRATRETRIAPSTLRSRLVPRGAMVLAANHSAMFDPLDVADARQFRTDRAWETYIHWGHGLHECFGAQINLVLIPAMLKPLLSRRNLRRAGPRDDGGTPFPRSLPVTFDA